MENFLEKELNVTYANDTFTWHQIKTAIRNRKINFNKKIAIIGIIFFIVALLFMCVAGAMAILYGNWTIFTISLLTALFSNLTYWAIVVCLIFVRGENI